MITLLETNCIYPGYDGTVSYGLDDELGLCCEVIEPCVGGILIRCGVKQKEQMGYQPIKDKTNKQQEKRHRLPKIPTVIVGEIIDEVRAQIFCGALIEICIVFVLCMIESSVQNGLIESIALHGIKWHCAGCTTFSITYIIIELWKIIFDLKG